MNNKVIKNRYLLLFCLSLISFFTFGQGSKYTGPYKKSSPVTYYNKKNVVIEGLDFSDLSTTAITLNNCSNVTIRNCKFKNNLVKPSIYAYRSSDVTVTNNTFENVHQGFVVGESYDNIKFEYNDVKNIVGTLYGGSPFSQAVQVLKSNGAGYSISYNAIENISGKSAPEDIINIYQSNGTVSSPITIKGNWIRGGGPSASGGGIMMGDWGGSNQIAEDNILVNPGMYGIGIAGGKNNKIRNNKVYSKQFSYSNVAIQAADYTPSQGGPASNILIENNEVNFLNSRGMQQAIWLDASMQRVANASRATTYNSKLNEDVLPKVIIGRIEKPEEETPNQDNNSKIAQVYIDRFNRITIKYLVTPIPRGYAENYAANGQLLETIPLPRYNQSFPVAAPKGDYYIKITYSDLGKTETTKITVR